MNVPPILPDRIQDLAAPCFADIFGDHMVIQAGRPVPVWGFGPPGGLVTVRLGRQAKTTRTRPDGIWQVRFKPLQAGYEPLDLTVGLAGSATPAVCLQQVLAGEVWFCSGQSNMELGLGAAHDGQNEVAAAADPALRLFMVQKTAAPIPLRSLAGDWKPVTPQTVAEQGWGGFSAVAFHFGQYLRRELDCPVGLIQSAFGGAKIHPFLQPDQARRLSCLRQEYREQAAARQTWLAQLAPQATAFLSESAARASHPFNGFDQWDTLKLGGAWNAMVHPLLPFACRGVLWYQGESDVGSADVYPAKLRALQRGFQRDLGTREFLLVQIAPWRYGSDQELLDLWQAQYRFCDSQGCLMASTVDVGDMGDIHPLRKRPVGERLARLALYRTYGRIAAAGSPKPGRIRRLDQGFLVGFEVPAGPLSLNAAALQAGTAVAKGFRLHLADGTVQPVDGSVEGNGVRLCCEQARRVVAISYAWVAEADGNLVNSLGEPAFPFYRRL